MGQLIKKRIAKFNRHLRIRKKISGTTERPRLSVRRSLNHIYCQLIDDINQKTLFAFSTQNKEFLKSVQHSGNVQAASKLGEVFGPQMITKGIKKVALDRGGDKYHGRIKALAESLRKAGLEF